MSSEESDLDENNSEILKIKPLPWRSEECTKTFRKMDEYIHHNKSLASKRQMKRKTIGEDSSRPLPAVGTGPSFCIV